MNQLKRRDFMRGTGTSALGLSLRAAVTGLPLPFLLSGDANASEHDAKITIIATSSSGESVNTSGPGTFDDGMGDDFHHPTSSDIALDEIPSLTVNGIELMPDDLATPVDLEFGTEQVRVARMWSALPAAMREHLVWFNHQTQAGIHPQFPTVLRCNGQLRGELGRGDE